MVTPNWPSQHIDLVCIVIHSKAYGQWDFMYNILIEWNESNTANLSC